MADYLPTKDTNFLEWALNFVALCVQNQARWGLPAAETTALNTEVYEYKDVYETAIGPSASKAEVLLKNEKKAALVGSLRDFKRRSIDPNTAVTDPDRERLRLPIYSNKLTRIPPPSTTPEFEFTYPGARRINVHFRDFRSKSKAKPKV